MLGIYQSLVGYPIADHNLKSNFKSISKQAGLYSVCLIYPDFKDTVPFYQDGEDWILIDGIVFDDNSELNAKELLHAINNNIDLKKLNGEFFVSYCIGGELNFFNDRLGQRQHCFVQFDDICSIAPTPVKALELAGKEKNINKKAFYFFINSKKLRLNRDTIWAGCKVIEPGVIVKAGISLKLAFEKYYEFNFKAENEYNSVEKLVEIYSDAVNLRVSNDYSKGVTLTGGLDSRTMVCAIENTNLDKVKAFTSGMEGCTEIEFATEVASNLSIEYEAFKLKPEDIFSEASLDYFSEEDIDLIIQGQWKPFLKCFEGCDYLLHGLDLDVTIGGIYLTDKVFDLQSDSELVDYINNESFINLSDSKELFRKDIFNKYHSIVENTVAEIVSNCKQNSIQEKYDYFVLMHSMNRVILQRYRAIRSEIETISPMYDAKLLEYYAKVPINDRKFYKLFFPFMKNICGENSTVKYQRTNLPADTPVEFWGIAQDIEKKREELYRSVAKETNGEKFIHYNGYYTNVDEWMRFNASWKKAIFELLQSPESIIRMDWVEPDYIDKLINEHVSHEKSHMSTLMRLMSGEVFLRLNDGQNTQQIAKDLSL